MIQENIIFQMSTVCGRRRDVCESHAHVFTRVCAVRVCVVHHSDGDLACVAHLLLRATISLRARKGSPGGSFVHTYYVAVPTYMKTITIC